MVEDNAADRNVLMQCVVRYFGENGEYRVTEFDNAVTFLGNYHAEYDVVFLDIQMPNLDGMQAARRLRQLDPQVPIVFITNMAQFAIDGYSVGALNFLLKPISYPLFASTLRRVVAEVERSRDSFIILKVEGAMRKQRVSSIRYVEVVHNRLVFHTDEGNFEVWGSLKDIETKLPQGVFSRCNNCFLVNLREVKSIKGYSVFVGDEELQISRPRKKAFVQDLNRYIGGK